MNIVEVQANDFPVDHVVVYQDKCQVSRRVKAQLKQGLNNVVVQDIKVQLQTESLRVDGEAPKGAQIMDVVHTKEHKTQENTSGEVVNKTDELRRKLSELNKQKQQLTYEIETADKSMKMLDNYAQSIHQLPGSSQSKSLLDQPALDGFERFLTLMTDKMAQLQTKKLDLREKISAVDREIEAASMSAIDSAGVRAEQINQVSVLVESQEDQEAVLVLHYLVFGARWTPTYDLRVNSEDKKLKVVYKAEIVQSTGEDWKEASLILSTAKPSAGGVEPVFQWNWNIGLGQSGPTPPSAPMAYLAYAAAPETSLLTKSEDLGLAEMAELSGRQRYAAAPRSMERISMPVSKGISASTFTIPSKQTIPSDGVAHNVTVVILEFEPQLSYSTTPKLSEDVFLKAEITNSSDYAFLEGNSSVFLDDNFIAKSRLSNVTPGEKVHVSLGSDPGVTIKYRPLERVNDTARMGLNRQNVVRCLQSIVVKNTKQDAIYIKVVDQLPKSTNAKSVTVSVVEPANVAPQPKNFVGEHPLGVFAGDYGCVEWYLKLDPFEERILEIKYDVSYPVGERLTGL